MPNRKAHAEISVPAGLIMAAYRARNEPALCLLVEAIGGAAGGYVGGRLPDIFEPSHWPGHRDFAHSMTAGSGIFFGLQDVLKRLEDYCRSTAEDHRKAWDSAASDREKLILGLAELLMHLLSGFAWGVCAGYLSHLALDSNSRKSLPLLGRL